jgi:hypothetical protein
VLGPATPWAQGKHVVSKVVTIQESASESQEPSDSGVLATTVLDKSGLLSSVLPTQHLLAPGFWLLTPTLITVLLITDWR